MDSTLSSSWKGEFKVITVIKLQVAYTGKGMFFNVIQSLTWRGVLRRLP